LPVIELSLTSKIDFADIVRTQNFEVFELSLTSENLSWKYCLSTKFRSFRIVVNCEKIIFINLST